MSVHPTQRKTIWQGKVAVGKREITLNLLRVVFGFLFACHGYQKLFGAFGKDPQPLMSLPGLAGVLELFGGILIMIGLFTRPVAFILSGEMAFAYFLGHMFKKPEEPVFLPLLNGGTAAILFCFACLYISAAGGGSVSVDALIGKESDAPGGALARR